MRLVQKKDVPDLCRQKKKRKWSTRKLGWLVRLSQVTINAKVNICTGSNKGVFSGSGGGVLLLKIIVIRVACCTAMIWLCRDALVVNTTTLLLRHCRGATLVSVSQSTIERCGSSERKSEYVT
jgi:hypothetical protein